MSTQAEFPPISPSITPTRSPYDSDDDESDVLAFIYLDVPSMDEQNYIPLHGVHDHQIESNARLGTAPWVQALPGVEGKSNFTQPITKSKSVP